MQMMMMITSQEQKLSWPLHSKLEVNISKKELKGIALAMPFALRAI
jgi:hypothetical protein